jgi:hypothetical protein
MKRKSWRLAALIVVLLGGVAAYFLFFNPADRPSTVTAAISPPPAETPAAPESTPLPPPTPITPPPVPEPPAILHPIEPAPPVTPLPDLGQSAAPFRKILGEILGRKGLALMLSEELIHHIVVTVDNLPRKHLPAAIVPLKRAEGAFITDGKDETLAIGKGNAARYAAYVSVAKTIDSAKLVAVYRRFYPLFQKAYGEIGYPKANFNDRLVVALDDLLAAPDLEPPVRLQQPKILFEYADPDLEARSAGQKIMMRIGRENAGVLKKKLAEVRKLVASP